MNRKGIWLLLSGLILCVGMTGCEIKRRDSSSEMEMFKVTERKPENTGSTSEKTQEMIIEEEFTSLYLSDSLEVEVILGDSYSVSLTGEPEELEEYRWEISDGILRIEKANINFLNWNWNQRVKAKIQMPKIQNMEVSDSTDVFVARNMEWEEKVKLVVEDSSSVDVKVSCNELDVQIQSSSEVKGEFKSDSLSLLVSGSSDLSGGFVGEKITGKGASSSNLSFSVDAKNAELRVSDSSDWDGNFEVGDLILYTTSSSSVELSGKIKDLDLILKDSSDFDGTEAEIREAKVEVRSSSDAKFNQLSQIKGEVKDSSTIYLYGQGIKADIKENSSGEVIYK